MTSRTRQRLNRRERINKRGCLTGVVVALSLIAAPVPNRGGDSWAWASSIKPRVADTPLAGSPADRAISQAQAQLRKTPKDTSSKKALAAAYLQKVREYADPSYYTRAGEILASLGGARSSDPEVLLLEGNLLLARHEFTKALSVGKQAAFLLPASPAAQAILVDAYNELGRYGEALAATQRMADMRPDLAAFARVSYARELRGDLPGAIVAMQQAASAGAGGGEPAAYIRTLLGNLLLESGNVAGAAASYRDALHLFPGLAGARAGQAAILNARGRPGEAAALMSDVVASQPLIQYAIAEGDYYVAAGLAARARDAYQLADAIIELYRANGVDVDLEVAVYHADHRPSAALLATTRNALVRRPGISGQHALAWVLYRLGRHREAAAAMAKVIAIGDRDSVIRFHAAAIFAAAGDVPAAATQLDIVLQANPRAAGIDSTELDALVRRHRRTLPPFAR